MSEAKAAQAKPGKKKASEPVPIPLTLQGFYAEKRVKAPEFVRAIDKAAVRAFTPEDEQAAAALLDTADATRERTLALLAAAPKVRRRSITELLAGWTQRVVRRDAAALGAQDAFDSGSGPFSAEGVVEAMAQAVQPAMQGKDKVARRQAEARLRLTRAWAATRSGTDPIRLARHAAAAVQAKPEGKANQTPQDRALRFVASADLKTIDQALALVALTDAAMTEARANEAKAHQEAAELRRSVARLEGELGAARTEATDLSAALEAEKAMVAALERQLQDQRLSGEADHRATRGRMARFLRGRLLVNLEQAREATEMKPPRVDMTRDLLAQLENEIAGEIAWLNERSG
jgi:hypothetical protein